MVSNNDVWTIQLQLLKRLNIWARLNLICGLPLLLLPGQLWRSIGQQFLAWGSINFIIAVAGRRSFQKRFSASSGNAQVAAKESTGLQRLLWVNSILDILYIGVGITLAKKDGCKNKSLSAHGLGVVIQGLGLFVIDLWHALLLSRNSSGK